MIVEFDYEFIYKEEKTAVVALRKDLQLLNAILTYYLPQLLAGKYTEKSSKACHGGITFVIARIESLSTI